MTAARSVGKYSVAGGDRVWTPSLHQQIQGGASSPEYLDSLFVSDLNFVFVGAVEVAGVEVDGGQMLPSEFVVQSFEIG